jgi:hypothetical protein
MATQAFCIHGHFYQPPREDPLTGEIPLEQGAMPYRNWNERILDRCYRPNAQLDNFEHISFNLGPTLADWLAEEDAPTLAQIIQQDRMNYERYGVGNAMAQSYHHTILPLASRQDKVTQVRWGIGDFISRFGHSPAGLWLPEAGVDDETLEVLVEQGIEFVILAPWQADIDRPDTNHPYRVALPGGREIAVFFYDQDLSTRVSFDPGATVNGDQFLRDGIMPKFRTANGVNGADQFVIIASDGELYGHHQPFRDKFLAYIVDGAAKNLRLEISYPGLWLKQHPLTNKIVIRQRTSWSCYHGVARWSGSCDCTPHGEWKAPLRQALNLIATAVDEQYLKIMQPRMADPWEIRHRFIEVLSNQLSVEELFFSSVGRRAEGNELQQVELLLLAQYDRQRMFTSCGWFFEDFDRIEPVNNVLYAAQAVWSTYLATGVDLSYRAMACLRPVFSPRTGLRADAVFSQHFEKAREYTKEVQG